MFMTTGASFPVAYDREAPWWATTAEGWWPYISARPYIAGGFIWTGFDYRGEPTPYHRWPSVASYFGVMDSCGFAKDEYYYYRAWWQDAPRRTFYLTGPGPAARASRSRSGATPMSIGSSCS